MIDKQILYRLYWEDKLSAAQIGELLGVSHRTVLNWMVHYDIPRRSPAPLAYDIDPDWLREEYITKKRSIYDIARELGISHATIYLHLKRHDIPRRTRSQAFHLARGHHEPLHPIALEYVIGGLLGDGYLESGSGGYAARYVHTDKNLGYLEWLRDELHKLGLRGTIHTRQNTPKYRTYNYGALAPLRQLFYPKGRKRIPADLILTPIIVRQWYIGDGTLIKPRTVRQKPAMFLWTMGFIPQDVLLLKAKLEDLGFNVSYHPSRNSLYVRAASGYDFLEYIGPCPEAIMPYYGHKWGL